MEETIKGRLDGDLEIKELLKMFNIVPYNEKGEFDYISLISQCKRAYKMLNNNKPLSIFDEKMYIEFMFITQRLAGIRKCTKFLSLISK